MKKNILYIVIPCYNEEKVISKTTYELKKKLSHLIDDKKISAKSKVFFVDDGSTDNTWKLIKDISKKDKFFTGISLTRNTGHQNALLAGLISAKDYSDIIISMDADLQDDVDAIDEMIQKYDDGNEIVYGVRKDRRKDTFFKRMTAELFYKFMNIIGVEIIYNHADFRLCSKKVIDGLADYKEVNLFLRGIFPLIGYKSDIVYYERKKRVAGKTKYSVKKMLNFAWDGITSFSIKPVRFILNLGIIIFMLSLIILIYSLIVKLLGKTVEGWTFIVCSIWLVSGIQMLSLGIIGEYIGKVYSETKKRPRYVILDSLIKNKKV